MNFLNTSDIEKSIEEIKLKENKTEVDLNNLELLENLKYNILNSRSMKKIASITKKQSDRDRDLTAIRVGIASCFNERKIQTIPLLYFKSKVDTTIQVNKILKELELSTYIGIDYTDRDNESFKVIIKRK